MNSVLISVENEMGLISITIPIKTVSEANSSEHWTKKSKRHNQQKFIIKIMFRKCVRYIDLPCTIKLTRIAPRALDYDNLCCSMKWCLDAICDCLVPGLKPGRADGDERISVEYYQEKGMPKEYALKIDVLF